IVGPGVAPCWLGRELPRRRGRFRPPEQLGYDQRALHLPRRRLRQISVPEVQHLDALPEGQLGRDAGEMLLDLGPVLARRRNAEAGDALVAFAVGQADDRELLDPRRGAVDLLQLV